MDPSYPKNLEPSLLRSPAVAMAVLGIQGILWLAKTLAVEGSLVVLLSRIFLSKEQLSSLWLSCCLAEFVDLGISPESANYCL